MKPVKMLGFRWRKAEVLLPRTFTDAAAFTLISCAIPIVYWFEVFVVMPRVFNNFFHVFHIFLGTFVLLNIITNFAMMIIVDTSTSSHIMPATDFIFFSNRLDFFCKATVTVPNGWHVCAPCENVAPPRSRHCGVCGCCILKREHHCIFTGCCIGLYNHRFFFCFLVYMWASTLYCSVVNAFFISPYIEEDHFWWTCIRILLPGLWLIVSPSADTFYGFLFSLNVIGCLFLSVLLYYYTRQMLTNITTRERTDNCPISYDRGTLHNIQVVLGRRWYLVWLFPLVPSLVPYDGLDWSKQTFKTTLEDKSK